MPIVVHIIGCHTHIFMIFPADKSYAIGKLEFSERIWYFISKDIKCNIGSNLYEGKYTDHAGKT